MLHNEILRKDEMYEILHDNNGNAVHIVTNITYGGAIVFPSLNSLIANLYLGKKEESFHVNRNDVDNLYSADCYDYYELKERLT